MLTIGSIRDREDDNQRVNGANPWKSLMDTFGPLWGVWVET
ncbi:hypothetical protein N9B31_09460 [Mariniblastus sp.]|nr:hypothetical protein [Mariniblastus sp.]